MIVNTNDPRTRFQSMFYAWEESLNGQKNTKMHEYRTYAVNRLMELQFPTTREEDWKYTSVHRMIQPLYRLPDKLHVEIPFLPVPSLFENKSIRLTFYNGKCITPIEHLPQGLHLLTFEEALGNERFKDILINYFLEKNRSSSDIFSLLNLSFIRDKLLIVVDQQAKIEETLYLDFQFTCDRQPMYSATGAALFLERNAQLQVVEHYRCLGECQHPLFVNVLHQAHIEEGACVGIYKVQEMESQSTSMIYTAEITQAKDSRLFHFNAELGSRLVRNNIRIGHGGAAADSQLYGLFMGLEDQHSDTQSVIDHAQAFGTSREWYRAILKDQSRGVFNGRIMVRQDAQKINAYQQNDTLLLSEKARMDTKPQLEIFADDVKCSHGATIGQLNEDELFYLMSRGLKPEEAKATLLGAFAMKIVDHIEEEQIRNFVTETVLVKLSKWI